MIEIKIEKALKEFKEELNDWLPVFERDDQYELITKAQNLVRAIEKNKKEIKEIWGDVKEPKFTVRKTGIEQIQDKLKNGEITLPEVPNFINCDWATGESYSYRTELKDGEIKVEEIKTEDMYPIEHCSPNLKKAA